MAPTRKRHPIGAKCGVVGQRLAAFLRDELGEIGPRATPVACDLADLDSVAAAAEMVRGLQVSLDAAGLYENHRANNECNSNQRRGLNDSARGHRTLIY